MIGMVSPGAMGAAIGSALAAGGQQVGWASEGRSAATRSRAESAGLVDLGSLTAVRDTCELVMSICPPADALSTAEQFAGYSGLYLDANAVSPATAARIGAMVRDGGGDFVDGGVIGPPPQTAGTTRLYLSGPQAGRVRQLLATELFDIIVLGDGAASASALKMTYAAWTKGSAALLLAIHSSAVQFDVADPLLAEWALSQPALPGLLDAARRAAIEKGWRWVAEMHEVADTFRHAGTTGSFGSGAAEVYAGFPRPSAQESAQL